MADYIDRAEAIKAVCRKCTARSVLTDRDDKAFSKAHCAEIRALQELPSAPGWISVKDRLPETNNQFEDDNTCFYYSEKVLVFRKGNNVGIGRLCETEWTDERFDEIGGVTHWMPMPAPPEEG